MKPTPPITSKHQAPRNFPVTDYAFHASAEEPTTATVESVQAKPRAFWKISAPVFGPKTSAEFVRELIAFTAVAGLSAWPIFIALHAVTRMVRGY